MSRTLRLGALQQVKEVRIFMVEKIIINPNEVRGYGNIMSPHNSTDYELSDCTITETTDTVNGQTMTVYELEAS